MKHSIRRSTAFLGIAFLATQLFAANNTGIAISRGSSSSFQQATPVNTEQKEIESLLKQISLNAAFTARHADALDSFTRVGQRLSLDAHVAELNGAKAAINSMGADFRALQKLRSAALPWQESVINRLEPMLIGLAGQATNATQSVKNLRDIPSQDYRDAIAGIDSYAAQTHELIDVHLDYAEAREKLNQFDASLSESAASDILSLEASKPTPKAVKSLDQRLRSELLQLPYYGVFDYLAFQVNDGHVTITGYVSQPVLKADAEKIARSMEGVSSVSNTIELLPLSPNDDRIRLAAYRAIYGHASMTPYRLNPHSPIRIIVENGNVTLKGVVSSDLDRTLAFLQANSVPGVFSVTNHLELGS